MRATAWATPIDKEMGLFLLHAYTTPVEPSLAGFALYHPLAFLVLALANAVERVIFLFLLWRMHRAKNQPVLLVFLLLLQTITFLPLGLRRTFERATPARVSTLILVVHICTASLRI